MLLLLLPHVLQALFPAVHDQGAVMELFPQIQQLRGELRRRVCHGAEILPLPGRKYLPLSAETVGVVASSVEEGGELLQFPSGKRKGGHGALRRGGTGVGFTADPVTHIAVGGVEALVQSGGECLHRADGLLIGKVRALIGAAAIPIQPPLTCPCIERQRNHENAQIGGQQDLRFFLHKNTPLWDYLLPKEVCYACC